MAAEPGVRPPFWKKPFGLWVAFGGLAYVGVALLAVMAAFRFFDPTIVVFAALFFVTAVLSLAARRAGLIAGTVLSVVFIGFYTPFIGPTLANPADPAFPTVWTAIPALILVALFSILSLVKWKQGIANVRSLATPQSAGGLVTLAVVGLVVGGLVVGNFAAATIVHVLSTGGTSADIRIVPMAGVGPAGGIAEPFSPATFTVSLASGGRVTWFNGDTTWHTVTSNTSGQFDSGVLNAGDSWSFTFTQAGTYLYHCTPHVTTMWGKVVVTP